jgi:hypothetical protein
MLAFHKAVDVLLPQDTPTLLTGLCKEVLKNRPYLEMTRQPR